MNLNSYPIFISIFFITLFSPSSPLMAQELKQPYSNAFTGAFVELSARSAFSTLSKTKGESTRFELGVRQAFPMHLLDTRISMHSETFNISNTNSPIHIYGANISTGFHPLYLALLFENWLGWVLASIYLEGSLGLNYSQMHEHQDFGFAYSIGAGIDLPLWNPNDIWSIWVNGLYRYRRLDFDTPDREFELHNHAAFIGLGIRWNGLLF